MLSGQKWSNYYLLDYGNAGMKHYCCLLEVLITKNEVWIELNKYESE